MAAVLGKKIRYLKLRQKNIFLFFRDGGERRAHWEMDWAQLKDLKNNIAHGDFYLVSVLKEHQIPASNMRFRDFTRLSFCSGLWAVQLNQNLTSSSTLQLGSTGILSLSLTTCALIRGNVNDILMRYQ